MDYKTKRVNENMTWPFFDNDEIDTVVRILESGKVNYWTGKETRLFEEEFAKAMNCKYAVALANGTVAIEVALMALGLKQGDEVIVTPRTFIASASSAIIHGIKPIFADVDRDSGNISAEAIEAAITPKTKAIIAVHLAGWPCDMKSILEVAKKYNLKVIEDCAQCHGAKYDGIPCGSFGDIAAWSFCQDKIMTTGGEGGMVTTNDESLWRFIWEFKDHGKNYDKTITPSQSIGFRWLHDSFGTNLRITEMQSAIGRIQLAKLTDWVAIRRRNAFILADKLSDIPCVRLPMPPDNIYHAYYKFYIYIIPEMLKNGQTRDGIIEECEKNNIPCFSGSCSEIYLEDAFKNANLQPASRLPAAKELGETSIMFLVHPTITEERMEDIAVTVKSILTK